MSIRVKPLDKSAEKFRKRVEVAGPDYESGVKNPRRNWLENFRAVADAVAEAIKRAADERRFLAGAERAGVAKWQNNTIRKGVSRWKEETPKSAEAWRSGFSPYARELETIALPPRRPKGDPFNFDERSKPTGMRLHQKKLELKGAKPT